MILEKLFYSAYTYTEKDSQETDNSTTATQLHQ